MVTLLLDSSNVNLCVGLASEEVFDHVIYEAWQAQSEYMVKEIDNLLKKHNLTRKDIKDIMVSIGPGSYTGIRISLTIAKIIGMAINVPIYRISSLHILKDGNKKSICLLNARSNRSYVGIYQGDNCLLTDRILTNEEVKKLINDNPDAVICGDTSYLGIEGHISNVIIEMFSIKNSAPKDISPIEIKPIYLKD